MKAGVDADHDLNDIDVLQYFTGTQQVGQAWTEEFLTFQARHTSEDWFAKERADYMPLIGSALLKLKEHWRRSCIVGGL